MPDRMKAVVAEVQRVNADIVCFQEVNKAILHEILEQHYIQENYYVSDISGKTLGSYGVVSSVAQFSDSSDIALLASP